MRNRARRNAGAAFALAMMLGVRTAMGCAFADVEPQFHSDHPDSVPVAAAAAREIAAGRLRLDPTETSVQLLSVQLAATTDVKRLGERIAGGLPPGRVAELPEFFLLLVQTRLWGRLRPDGDGFSENCDPVAPELIHEAEARGAILVTSEPVLRELAAGRMTFTDAEQRGLVIADGDAGAVRRLRTALTEALH